MVSEDEETLAELLLHLAKAWLRSGELEEWEVLVTEEGSQNSVALRVVKGSPEALPTVKKLSPEDFRLSVGRVLIVLSPTARRSLLMGESSVVEEVLRGRVKVYGDVRLLMRLLEQSECTHCSSQ